MKIIGIDIAIENLAFCAIEKNENDFILKKEEWFVLDTTPEEYKHDCCYINRKKCSKDAGWFYVNKESGLNIYYCAAHKKIVDKEKKLTWKTLNKNYINNNHVICSIFSKLDDYLDYFNSADYILIEKQPPKNPKMISIMNYLYSYFVIRLWNDKKQDKKLKDIILIDAKNKITYCLDILDKQLAEDIKNKWSKNKYQYYKKLSIATIEKDDINKDLLDYFNEHKKKDDLADSKNMVMWWIKKSEKKDKTVVKKVKKTKVNS